MTFFRILKKEILGAGVLSDSDYFSLRIITYIIKKNETLIFYNGTWKYTEMWAHGTGKI